MANIVERFLRKVASSQGYTVFDSIFGNIVLNQTAPIKQSSGAVYGIWVQSNVSPGQNVKSIPGHKNWYPVYWGKDIAPVSRMKAHVQGHQNNGNINLRGQANLQNKDLIYAAILVSNYQRFEQLLHQRYQPLIGTKRVGSRSKIIEIVN